MTQHHAAHDDSQYGERDLSWKGVRSSNGGRQAGADSMGLQNNAIPASLNNLQPAMRWYRSTGLSVRNTKPLDEDCQAWTAHGLSLSANNID